jgi:hypothetical protein
VCRPQPGQGAKKQEKLKRLEEETAKRKAARGDEPNAEKNQKDV